MEINTYNEDVIHYLKEHPNADLDWYAYDDVYYKVYDLNIFVAKVEYRNKPLMQYYPKDMNKLTVWTYNTEKEQFEGKDTNGKLVQKVYAYSKPYIYSEASATKEESESVSEPMSSNEASVDNDKVYIVNESGITPVTASTTEGTVKADTSEEMDTESVTASVEQEESEVQENTETNSTQVILIIIGVLIIIGIIVIIVMLKKKKAE